MGIPALTPRAVPGEAPNPVEVSYPQEQLWFLSQLGPANIAYNVPVAWKLLGSLDIDALERSLDEIVRRHESLRTSFPLMGGKPMQYGKPAPPFRLEIVDIRALQKKLGPFTLSSGPVFRTLLLRCADQQQILLLNVCCGGWFFAGSCAF